MTETAIHLNDVVITGNPFLIEDKTIAKPLVSLSRLDLDLVRNNSLGEMLNYQTGVSMVSNGVAVSRPVIRGFGSSRILILEDGLRMGDLSGSSSDHSVSEDGSNPDKIEIVRGPSALLYSGSSPGGVINIITDLIPSTIPDKLMGSLSMGGNYVSDQKVGNAELFYGEGRMSYEAGAFYRKGNDYRAPSSERIMNSSLETKGFRAGLSFQPMWGIAGHGINKMKSVYGIPFNKVTDDEEGPVYLDMNKTDYRVATQIDSVSSLLPQISFKGGFQDYSHKEISRLTQQTGSRFTLKSVTGDLFIKHKLFGNAENINGGLGVWGINQKYTVRGDEALTPDADNTAIAIYLFEQIALTPFNLEGALRFEQNKVSMPPAILTDSLFPGTNKSFTSVSAALGISYNLTDELSLMANLTNTNRAPGVEELSSYAVHAALASFDVGNRNLTLERDYAIDGGIRFTGEKFYLEINSYYNMIDNYIFRNPTGLFYNSEGFNSELGVPVYQYIQSKVEIYGAELKSILDITEGLSVTLSSDFVRGKYRSSDQNLPLIPPFRFSIEPKYIKHEYWAGLTFRASAEQNKVALNETPTKGYGIIDVFGGVKLLTGSLIHQFDLKIENLLNKDYREHLSVLKSFAPMPGRNFLVTYKLLF